MARNDAQELNARAGELAEEGRHEEAARAYLDAAALDPSWGAPLYNLGLMHKYLGNWKRSLHANLDAALRQPDDQATWWNAGIAATALSDWKTAREAWAKVGIELPAGEGEPRENLGLVPVRLNPNDAGEVVWARRIDPARAVVENVPLPDSNVFWKDTLLHDGAPNGYRSLDGHEVPVFDCLTVLERSGFSTFTLTAADCPSTFAALDRAADKCGAFVEDWSTNIRLLCRACSEGKPDPSAHNHGPTELRTGVAARDEAHLAELLRIAASS